MNNENKTYRGMLIDVILTSIINDSLFDIVDGLKENIQEKLNLNLKFETNVSDIETIKGYSVGQITFEDEFGEMRVINYTLDGNDTSSDECCGSNGGSCCGCGC